MKVRTTYTGSGWMLLQDVPCNAMIVAYGLTNEGVHAAQLEFNKVACNVSSIDEARKLFVQLDAEAGNFPRMNSR